MIWGDGGLQRPCFNDDYLPTFKRPNFMGFIQGGVSVNVTVMYDHQAHDTAHIMKQVLDRGKESVEPTLDAQEAWARTGLERQSSPQIFVLEGACHAGDLSGTGTSSLCGFAPSRRDHCHFLDNGSRRGEA